MTPDIQHAIWWTSQEDIKQLGESPEWPEAIPEYIRDQYADRAGRNGRGRLWCAPNMPEEVSEWPIDNRCAAAAETCGGIVINAADAPALASLPGFLTTMDMRWLKVTPPPNTAK